MSFPSVNVHSRTYGPGLAIASNGTLAPQVVFMPGQACEVLRARFYNGGRTAIASATASASAATVALYKNASGTASYAATINNLTLAMGSTVAGMKMTNGPIANRKLAADDILLLEVLPGSSGAFALAAGWTVDIDYAYGDTGA